MIQSRLPVRPFEIVYDAAEPYKQPVEISSPEDGMRVRWRSESPNGIDCNKLLARH